MGVALALLTVGQGRVLADTIAGFFDAAPGLDYLTPVPGTREWPALAPALLALAGIFAAKAGLNWLNTLMSHRAAAAVKSQLRRDIVAARLADPLADRTSTAGLVNLTTVGLDALDGFYSKYLPQLALACTVPLIVGAAIALADLQAALIIVLTLPLIPVFMALVGWTTEARTKKRWRTQQRLARHFADLVAGLPTLQVFGRARAQAIGLTKTEDASRAETMGTLRVSFLSAFVLELLATLSVAVIAVTVGFRVVYGDLELGTALFVLILAPEVYLPVRQVGVHYHDAADGMAAADQAFAVIDAAGPSGPAGPAPAPEASEASEQAGPVLRARGLGHTYPGADGPAVTGVDLTVGRGEFVVLTGPSGGGKTTVLNALMGFLRPSAGALTLPARRRIAFVGQDPGMVNGTIADNLRLADADADATALADALARAGAAGMDPERPVGDDGEGLSAGERRRVATARALLRIDAGADVLLLDEPTAGLDADAEAALLRSLRGTGVTVVVVSHRPAVLAEADRVVTIGAAS
ncbi:thiol reductant ABC exporter subunit CydD [Propioniciclava coleopterorum]|uniref:thiol reductant ABC exporter subunit CydD n=1 Tax=Propioniciclava coleopterorum TaxID=2714937 RepID=UPI001FECB541|nr:thiol reductant ABC exporter subunit CydD [Propioniciclava coleopterorum]